MIISFRSYFDEPSNKFYINADEFDGEIIERYLIEDSYNVELIKSHATGEIKAFEKGGRLEAFANDQRLHLNHDLHVNGGGDLCVAPKNILKYRDNCNDQGLFIDQLLIPYLYSNSYYELNGTRPWKDYDHNEVGYFEAYIREDAFDSKERLLVSLFALKDVRFDLAKLKDPTDPYFEDMKTRNLEAYNGALKLCEDVKRFRLEKHLR